MSKESDALERLADQARNTAGPSGVARAVNDASTLAQALTRLEAVEREVAGWDGRWHKNSGPCGYMLRIAKHVGHERGRFDTDSENDRG